MESSEIKLFRNSQKWKVRKFLSNAGPYFSTSLSAPFLGKRAIWRHPWLEFTTKTGIKFRNWRSFSGHPGWEPLHYMFQKLIVNLLHRWTQTFFPGKGKIFQGAKTYYLTIDTISECESLTSKSILFLACQGDHSKTEKTLAYPRKSATVL